MANMKNARGSMSKLMGTRTKPAMKPGQMAQRTKPVLPSGARTAKSTLRGAANASARGLAMRATPKRGTGSTGLTRKPMNVPRRMK